MEDLEVYNKHSAMFDNNLILSKINLDDLLKKKFLLRMDRNWIETTWRITLAKLKMNC